MKRFELLLLLLDCNFTPCLKTAANSLRKKCLLLLLEMQLHPLPETAAIREENFYCPWNCNFTHCLKTVAIHEANSLVSIHLELNSDSPPK